MAATSRRNARLVVVLSVGKPCMQIHVALEETVRWQQRQGDKLDWLRFFQSANLLCRYM